MEYDRVDNFPSVLDLNEDPVWLIRQKENCQYDLIRLIQKGNLYPVLRVCLTYVHRGKVYSTKKERRKKGGL